MIDEIRSIPESILSFQQASYDFFIGWHTGISSHERIVASILRNDVKRLVDVAYEAVQDEAARAVREKIGDCPGIIP